MNNNEDERVFRECAQAAVVAGMGFELDGHTIVPPQTMAILLRERGRDDLAREIEAAHPWGTAVGGVTKDEFEEIVKAFPEAGRA